jgi:ATP-dependent RNA helicase DDX46/PRP5
MVKALEAAGQEVPDDILAMSNTYKAKKAAGELTTKDYRVSGFKSGRGHAFDAESLAKGDKAKRDARKREQRAAGVEMDDDSDDDTEFLIKGASGQLLKTTEGAETSTVASARKLEAGTAAASNSATLSVAAAAAAAAKAIQVKLGNISGANAAGAAVEQKMLAASKSAAAIAKSGEKKAADAILSLTGGGSDAAATAASAAGNAVAAAQAAAEKMNQERVASLPEGVRRAMAAAAAKAASANAAAMDQARAMVAGMGGIGSGARFSTELEINDYPQQARHKVMMRECILGVSEFTKAAITAKGAYYPPGRNPPAGERKLHFLIEAETEGNVKAARKELRRALAEYSAGVEPTEAAKYSKYSV